MGDDLIKEMKLQEAAVKGLAAVGEWLVVSNEQNTEVLEAFVTLKEWMFPDE